MELNKTNILIIIVGLSFLAFMFVMFKLIEQNSECTANPLVYGAKQLEENNNPVLCTCLLDNATSKPFFFDEEEIYFEHPLLGGSYNYP